MVIYYLEFGYRVTCQKNQVNCGIHVSLYACMSQLVPKSTHTQNILPRSIRTQVNSYPSQLVPKKLFALFRLYFCFIRDKTKTNPK